MDKLQENSVGYALVFSLREVAHAYAPGDQVRPCAVLWYDPERLWESIIPDLRAAMDELFVLGPYSPQERRGPALWLRCIEGRSIEGAPPEDVTPVFYLPGVAKEVMKDLENIPDDLAPLAELQFRGAVWLHVNGKEWTPYAFMVTERGGLNLDVARDQAALDALSRSLPQLLRERLDDLRNRQLNADYFNELVAPDATGQILRWLHNPEGFREQRSASEWEAFGQQCKSDYGFDPEKDGAIQAAKLLANRDGRWKNVWQRFVDAPANYRGVVGWLRRAAPKNTTLFDTEEVWPTMNEDQEKELDAALKQCIDKPQDEAVRAVKELEARHGKRRQHVWRTLGMSPFAVALEPLNRLATLVEKTPGGATPEAFGERYANQCWEVDAAALAVMASCDASDLHDAVLGAVRALYLPWLDGTARHLQQLLRTSGTAPERRIPPPEPKPGRVVVFADGLRFDVAKQLAERLSEKKVSVELDWDWSPLPTVTATAKPHCSPLSGAIRTGEIGDEFAPNSPEGKRLTQDRFLQALQAAGWATVSGSEVGEPEGSGWTEAGTLDKRGHNEGWKLAHVVASEVRELANRILKLLRAGWSEVVVVTDHGWLLMPKGLPKVELKSFLAEHRWGRCAALKSGVDSSGLPEFKWRWNEDVRIVTPPGVGCFKAGLEYSHGGVSLQEMVVPRIVVRKSAARLAEGATIAEATWTGARCRIRVEGASPGMKVDIRTRLNDADASLLDGSAKEIGEDGSVSVFLEDDGDIGGDASIVLLDTSGQVIHSLETVLGHN